MARKRLAQIVAGTLLVLCPHCSEPQPDPENGSDMWTPEEVRDVDPASRPCVACDEPMLIAATTKAQVITAPKGVI